MRKVLRESAQDTENIVANIACDPQKRMMNEAVTLAL
jgi:hypothetical protein